MVSYNISLNKELAEVVEEQMKRGKYASRSEFFRDVLREVFVEEAFEVESVSPEDPDYTLLKEERAKTKREDLVPFSEVKKKCS